MADPAFDAPPALSAEEPVILSHADQLTIQLIESRARRAGSDELFRNLPALTGLAGPVESAEGSADLRRRRARLSKIRARLKERRAQLQRESERLIADRAQFEAERMRFSRGLANLRQVLTEEGIDP